MTKSRKEKDNVADALRDEVSVPETMAEALEFDDPVAALKLLAETSHNLAIEKASKLQLEVQDFQIALPELLLTAKSKQDHPIYAATACSDSIYHSLTKIASGGSQASQEIRQLEQEKRELEEHAKAVELALMLRKNSGRAQQAMQTHQWKIAAEAVRPWLEWTTTSQQQQAKPQDEIARAYAGEYCLKQLATTHAQLKQTLLQHYESAVQASDLATLGQLTPVLSLVQLEQDAVRLYLQFLKSVLQTTMEQALNQPQQKSNNNKATPPPYIAMGRVYNAAVSTLRHHLPMVSHFLYKAHGDAAVVQLVHVQVEEAVLPLLERYSRDRQLSAVSRNAFQIYAALEERFTGRGVVDESENDEDDDCGFSVSIGSLSDADAAMEEAALILQHAESYLRFIQHTCSEVNKARQLRHDQAQKQVRLERERQEWTKGKSAAAMMKDEEDGEGEKELQILPVLPDKTPLHLSVLEIGGHYAAIERCLLLASMQRAFVSSDLDPRYYRPLALPSSSTGHSAKKALQTSVVEACLYAARHGTQRAFATGHTGTASAMTNFCSDCLKGVLLEVLSQRAEEAGVALLKPGEGLLAGSAGLFNNASNLIRQGAHVGSATRGQSGDDLVRRQRRVEQDVARACATINDLEVAVHHCRQLETLLAGALKKGFPPGQHETEQLEMCVKSLGHVTESFRVAANSTVDSLESVLKPRLRSIVGEAVGLEGSTFMGSSVMGGGKTADRVMVRMNYDLDEEAYNLLQVSEGYVARLCSLLDELLEPLRAHLAPRLWDALLLSVLGTVSKRLETSLRKCHFTALGALMLDSDVRDILSYIKDRLYSAEYSSNNVAVTRACPPLSRLLQIAKLLSVDDLDDVLDLISSAKRKGNWDLKLEDAKTLLSSRVEFEGSKVNELLRLPDED